MYNEQLEQLIDAALADGVLTEKEKQILFKKAQAMGIDLDEFEMVLDARLVKLKKVEEEKTASSAPKSNKLGDVKKCPACGAMVQSYQGSCPMCGYAFEGIDANSAVKELSDLLRKSKNPQGMSKIIDNFPIPTDKATLLAFITWLRPQCENVASYNVDNNCVLESFFRKYKECIYKINVSFAGDNTFQPFISAMNSLQLNVEKTNKRVAAAKRKEALGDFGEDYGLIILWILFWGAIIGGVIWLVVWIINEVF